MGSYGFEFDQATSYWKIAEPTPEALVAKLKEFTDSGNPLQLVYKLYTPERYPLSAEQLSAFISQNNTWSNTNDITEVSYSIHDTAPIRAAKHRIAANEPHIETIENSITHFDTDMVAPLKECKVYFNPIQDLHGYSKPWLGDCGKNLFNLNVPLQNPDNITGSNTSKRIFTPNTYFVGASYSNYWGSDRIHSYSIDDNSITVDSQSGYGVGFAISVTSGDYYIHYNIISGNGTCNTILYKTDGTSVVLENGGGTVKFTVPEDVNIAVIIFRGASAGASVTFSNIQVEKGSSFTGYEPYENICPIEGFTGITTYKSKKNLLPDGSFTRTYSDHGVVMEYSDGALHIQCDGTSTANYTFLGLPDTFSTYLPSGTYTLSGGTNKYGAGAITVYVLVNTLDIEFKSSNGNSVTKTIDGGMVKLQVAIKPTIPMDITIYPQLELGSTATEYEPYNGETIPIIWGKNLLNVSNETVVPFEISGYENYTIGNGSVSVTDYALVGFKVKCEPSTQYTFSYTSTAQFNMEVAAYTEEPTVIRNSSNFIAQGNAQTKTFTTPADAKWLTCGFYVLQSQAGSGITIDNLQLELGSSKTEYVPYICGTVYGGYVDLLTGEIIAEQIGATFTINDATDKNETYENTTMYRFRLYKPLCGQNSQKTTCCDKVNYSYSNSDVSHYYMTTNNANGNVYVWLPKDFSATDTVTIVASLYTPEVVGILTSAQFKALRGQNNIWSNSNGNVSVKYWAH